MWAGRKVQQTLFNPNDQPEENWAYVVERRFLVGAVGTNDAFDGTCGHWYTVPRPNHFRLEANAVLRAHELMTEFKRAWELKLVEFRVVPKYVGYVPPADEVWIS